MVDYYIQIDQIRKLDALEEIRQVARQFSAQANGSGGVLYSRAVGGVSTESIALVLADMSGIPIINRTPRGEFLSNGFVRRAILDSAQRIFAEEGRSVELSRELAASFQYGDPRAVANSLTSLDGCLWGDASREFAASLRGDVKVVASDADMERGFGVVELSAILENPNVQTLAGRSMAELRAIAASEGVHALLNPVQAQFLNAAPLGIYVAADTYPIQRPQ